MRLDKYSIPIYNSRDIFDLIYQGYSNKITQFDVELDKDLIQLQEVANIQLQERLPEDLSVEEFDSFSKTQWFMPDEYKNLDIENYILELIPPWDDANTRVLEELEEFKTRDMLDILRWMKYFVDTCTTCNIVWGVGRGSSVASYVLFLLGVHQIDSIKYNLDWRDFLR